MNVELSKFILKNRLLVSFIVFTIFFSLVILIKPNFIFDRDGSFREFGVGNTSKTVIPMWVFVIFIALMSYYLVNYIIAIPKINI
jgi:hypothetical protein